MKMDSSIILCSATHIDAYNILLYIPILFRYERKKKNLKNILWQISRIRKIFESLWKLFLCRIPITHKRITLRWKYRNRIKAEKDSPKRKKLDTYRSSANNSLVSSFLVIFAIHHYIKIGLARVLLSERFYESSRVKRHEGGGLRANQRRANSRSFETTRIQSKIRVTAE